MWLLQHSFKSYAKQSEIIWIYKLTTKTAHFTITSIFLVLLYNHLKGFPAALISLVIVITRQALDKLQALGTMTPLPMLTQSVSWQVLFLSLSLSGIGHQQLDIWKKNSFRTTVGSCGQCDKYRLHIEPQIATVLKSSKVDTDLESKKRGGSKWSCKDEGQFCSLAR